jgi:hypothetical protein
MTTTARNAKVEASVTMVRAAITLAATTASSDRRSRRAVREVVPVAVGQPVDAQRLVAQHPASRLVTDLRMENLRVTDPPTESQLAIAVLARSVQADLVRNAAPVALTAVGARNAAVAAIVPVHPERVEHPARALLEMVAHLAAEALVRAARIPGESASLS